MMGFRSLPALLLCLMLGVSCRVEGHTESPQAWPWRGMALSSISGDGADLAFLAKEIGVNSVSLQLKPRLRATRDRVSPAEALDLEFAWADRMLDACKANNVVAMVVMYQFPIDPGLGFDQKSPLFWSDPVQVEQMVTLSGMLAERFKNRGFELAGYQIQSEPAVREKGGVKVPDVWPATLRRIIEVIRAKDPLRWIGVTPGPGGTPLGYVGFAPLPYKRIIYNAHMYLPHRFTHQGLNNLPLGASYPGMVGGAYWDKGALERQLEPLKRFKDNYRVPVWIGEFSAARWGKGSENYLEDLVSIFEKNGFGWCYFAYNGAHVWNAGYNTDYAAHGDKDAAAKQFVGRGSLRWKTVRDIFGGKRDS